MTEAPKLHYNMDIPVIPHYHNGDLEYLLDNNELDSVVRHTIKRDICHYLNLTYKLRYYISQGYSAIQIPEKKNFDFYETWNIDNPSTGCDINWRYTGMKQSICEYIKKVFSKKLQERKKNIYDLCKYNCRDCEFSLKFLYEIYSDYFDIKNSHISFRF